MQFRTLIINAIVLLWPGIAGLKAQEAIPVSGGNASGSGGSVSYSVGQVVYTMNSGTNGSVANGVQKPFEIWVATGLNEAKGITLQCSAYPNPASDFLLLKIDSSKPLSIESISYQLFDITGKVLEMKNLVSNETNIVMRDFAPGIYYLKVMQAKDYYSRVGTQNFVSQREIKTFKIIKY